MTRARLRDLGITIGTLPTGEHNAITDVPGIWVGHSTIIADEPRVARTGVTIITPREGMIDHNQAFAGYHSFNGNGEMTGLLWVEESGMLGSPIAITNTHQVGVVRDALVAYEAERGDGTRFFLPVVAETFDGWLNDIGGFHVTKEHVYAALAAARGGPVAEGNVGGGTGMMCHDFKGGIGTASRVVDSQSGHYTVGALVQANYGSRHLLRVDGVPVGREIGFEHTPAPRREAPRTGSIIVVIASDAPLLPMQCKRLAQRATVGLARAGGVGANSSGDIFLAFATGNDLLLGAKAPVELRMVPNHHMTPFFEAVAEAVEESILNALTAAETMVGFQGRTAYALPLDELQRVWRKHRPA
ncbi:MAG: P1 family peptidase [Chloroflexi bacterium]|nr:P1 family peptidase [Chloroflexota bacterium]